MQVPFPDPGHGPVTDVVHAAMQVRHLAYTGYDLSLGRVVEARLGCIRIVPEYRVILVVDTVAGCSADKKTRDKLKWECVNRHPPLKGGLRQRK